MLLTSKGQRLPYLVLGLIPDPPEFPGFLCRPDLSGVR